MLREVLYFWGGGWTPDHPHTILVFGVVWAPIPCIHSSCCFCNRLTFLREPERLHYLSSRSSRKASSSALLLFCPSIFVSRLSRIHDYLLLLYRSCPAASSRGCPLASKVALVVAFSLSSSSFPASALVWLIFSRFSLLFLRLSCNSACSLKHRSCAAVLAVVQLSLFLLRKFIAASSSA